MYICHLIGILGQNDIKLMNKVLLVSKKTVVLCRWASETLKLSSYYYQSEVDKGKLTTVVSFEKLTFRVWALHRSKVTHFAPTKHSHSKRQFFKTHYAVNLPLSTSR